MTTFTVRTEHKSGGSLAEHHLQEKDVLLRATEFVNEKDTACLRLIVVPTHVMYCGHSEARDSDYCAEMSCSNYVMKHQHDEEENDD